MYLIHSPYPDGTWRGIEKCCGAGTTDIPVAVQLFDTPEDAQRYLDIIASARSYWVVVPVMVEIPNVRGALREIKKKAQECK
jgi:hypothetical protein